MGSQVGLSKPRKPSQRSRASSCQMILTAEPTHSPPPSQPRELGTPEGREGGEGAEWRRKEQEEEQAAKIIWNTLPLFKTDSLRLLLLPNVCPLLLLSLIHLLRLPLVYLSPALKVAPFLIGIEKHSNLTSREGSDGGSLLCLLR